MGDSGIPQPDVSGLPIEAPQSELNLQNASQAMTSQPQAPPLQGTKSGIKDLLSGFMGGMGRAMMVHAGIPTPEMEQEKQQQLQIQQQNAQSLQGLRDAQTQAYQYTPYQMPDGQTVDVAKKDIPTLLKSQIAAQAKTTQMLELPPELIAQHPELQGIGKVPAALLPYLLPKTAGTTAGKPMKVQYDQGIPVSITDSQGTAYDINDPDLPQALRPIRQSALNAHKQHVTEAAQIQARAFGQQAKMNEIKQGNLTTSTKTMIEASPKVINFVDRIDKLVDAQKNQLGPLAGRWNEFMTGKVGAPNADFARLRTDVGLMTTLLMRMHVGARGGEYIMKHFQDLVDSGKQSPENLKAALSEIRQYAQDVQSEAPAGSPAAARTPAATGGKMTIVNRQTGERRESTDGGRTWQTVR